MSDTEYDEQPLSPRDRIDARAADRKRRRRLTRSVAAAVAVAVAVLLIPLSCRPQQSGPFVAVAVGGMACDPTDPEFHDGQGAEGWCRQQAVSDLARSLSPRVLLGLGDYQYELPARSAYSDVYDPSWGQLRDITRPALGNQELKVFRANTFRSYFGDLAGPERGYWSFDEGSWHVVVLNSNCTTVVGGCLTGSPQQLWLEDDLASSGARCTIALWHHPRFSNGIMGPDQRTKDLWATLRGHDVEMVLSAHEHHYERFPRLDENGKGDVHGPRQFIAGTGGQVAYHPKEGDAPWRQKLTPPASEAVDFDHLGVLELTLDTSSYSWRFVTLDGSVTDHGTDDCH
jgi:hypothetical protein